MLMGLGRVFVCFLGMLMGELVIACSMMLCGGAVVMGGFLVVLGGFVVRFVRHSWHPGGRFPGVILRPGRRKRRSQSLNIHAESREFTTLLRYEEVE
jgi:hypothetical protein